MHEKYECSHTVKGVPRGGGIQPLPKFLEKKVMLVYVKINNYLNTC